MKKSLIFSLASLAMALFSTLLLTNCQDEDVDRGMPTLEISANELLFEVSGTPNDDNDGVLSIKSNREWKASIDEASKEWLTVEPLTGAGDAELHISMPAVTSGRVGSFTVAMFNSYGVLKEERITIRQGEVVQANAIFDGSELPVNYSANEVINVANLNFTINSVANFTEKYPDSNGPIQFAKESSYIYNNDAFEGLKEVVITLAPAGTSYNNFKVYAGDEMNPTEGEIAVGNKVGDNCYYTIPEGAKFIRIDNTAAYTAYASRIELNTTVTEVVEE